MFHKSKIWISPFISGRQAFKILVTDGIVTKLSVMIKVSNDFYVILHSLSSYCSPSCQNKWPAFPHSTQMPQCFNNKVIWAGATLLSAREKVSLENVWAHVADLWDADNSSREPWMACSVNSRALRTTKGFYPLLSSCILCSLTGRKHPFLLLSQPKKKWMIKYSWKGHKRTEKIIPSYNILIKHSKVENIGEANIMASLSTYLSQLIPDASWSGLPTWM